MGKKKNNLKKGILFSYSMIKIIICGLNKTTITILEITKTKSLLFTVSSANYPPMIPSSSNNAEHLSSRAKRVTGDHRQKLSQMNFESQSFLMVCNGKLRYSNINRFCNFDMFRNFVKSSNPMCDVALSM